LRSSAQIGALCVLLTGLVLPAHAGLFDDEVARKQVLDQGKRLDELRLQQDALAGRMTRLEDSLKVGQQPLLDLLTQIEQLRQEVKSLRGQIEVLGHNIEGTAKRQRDMYVDLDTRLRRLEQGAQPGAAPGASAPGAGGAAAAPAGAAQTASPEETRAYEAAQNQRRIGNYQAVIAAFQNFLAQYPKSPLAHRAQYWIGDSYYNLRDFKNAIANQEKLIATYPNSASVPDAMLNIASSQIELGNTAAGKKTMDGLVARYPASEAAEKAKRRLATLK
jgi:tol-pal system protein YbgF